MQEKVGAPLIITILISTLIMLALLVYGIVMLIGLIF